MKGNWEEVFKPAPGWRFVPTDPEWGEVFIPIACVPSLLKFISKEKLEKESSDKNMYKFLLVHVLESQRTLDILNYMLVHLKDDDIIDVKQISKELGYKEEFVQKVIDQAVESAKNKKEE